ncbi:hypothetical protein MKK88_23110 [Methylobacterium sp. E-005]|uniref:hypothetical protein n=1 Tax=Methylobacterium sp. E-005 TaxID=2836549 RepID=UPI001FBB74A5|nr:hypothetical protein [Methylobacterium sp. E-005]MCJ2088846.1 hypothetical protein [Methylobacterium sp. E-005]
MAPRPTVVAFDIIGTASSLEPLRPALTRLGLPAMALDWLYTATLRDTFARRDRRFAPLEAVLGGCLDELLALQGVEADPDRRPAVLGSMADLPPHHDAGAAFRIRAQAGIRIVAFDNGGAQATQALLAKAGLERFAARVLPIEDIGLAKRRPEVTRSAAEASGVAPGAMALVATHPWDVHGARSAGLVGACLADGRPDTPVLG